MAKILIADDSAVTRKVLQKIVTALGHVVVGEVPNGAQAFVEYTRLKPDVVTMDLTMEGMGGAQATSKIVAAFPEARIIVISAMEGRRVVIDALERGARHFIIKPINREKVAAALDHVLKQNIDLKKHLEQVRKLKGAADPTTMVAGIESGYLSPYIISIQGDNLVQVVISQTITLVSCQSLAMELGEHVVGKSNARVLFDFGDTETLDIDILMKLNGMIATIEKNVGTVRAMSNNKNFVDFVTEKIGDKAKLIGDVLDYFPG